TGRHFSWRWARAAFRANWDRRGNLSHALADLHALGEDEDGLSRFGAVYPCQLDLRTAWQYQQHEAASAVCPAAGRRSDDRRGGRFVPRQPSILAELHKEAVGRRANHRRFQTDLHLIDSDEVWLYPASSDNAADSPFHSPQRTRLESRSRGR